MKKKMIIYMSKLSVGGMEKSLLNLIKYSNLKKDYDITLYVLYSLEEEYIKELESQIKIDLLWNKKWSIVGKIVCIIKILFKLLKLNLKIEKYDVSICYPYQHKILSKLTRKSSNNSIIFIHSNILEKYQEKIDKHMKKIKYDKFNKVICVSNNALDAFRKLYPQYKGISTTINNYIDGENIITKSNEKIDKEWEKNKEIKFINIARHDEQSKKITRIINSTKKLVDEGYKFKVYLIGSGNSTDLYKSKIKDSKLEKTIQLLGKKNNPYPYLKCANCLILSSAYEGYGIVLDEARILEVPFITTDVADAKTLTEEGYGILCENSEQGIYNGMKKYLNEGFSVKNKFDYQEFNSKITEKLDEIIKK